MELVTIVLLAVASLKVTSVVQAIRWLGGLTSGEAASLQKARPTETEYYQTLDACRGQFFPFGIKDYRLQRYILASHQGHLSFRRLLGVVVSLFQAILYRYERLAAVVTVYTVVIASVIQSRHAGLLISPAMHAALLYILTIIVLATNSVLSVEAVFSYARLGGYAIPFHGLSTGEAKPAPGGRLLLDLRAVVGEITTTILTGAAAAYLAHVCFGGLKGDALRSLPISSVQDAAALFAQMIYWVTTTFTTVGYGDIVPANGYGQLVAFLISLQAFAVLAVVLASLFASKAQ